MPLFHIERETREHAIEKFLDKQRRKGKPVPLSGFTLQAGNTELSQMTILRRSGKAIFCDYEGILGRITLPLLPKKETAILPIGK